MSKSSGETPIVLDLGGPRPKTKTGSACKSHGIQVPYRGGFVFRCYRQVCPWCRAEKAEREMEEARKAHRAAITRQNDTEWQARGMAERLGWDGQGNAVCWLGSQIDAARAAEGGGDE